MAIGQKQQARLLELLCAALLLIIAVAIAYPRWRAWIDWRDEGLLAYGTVRVMDGQIPHRDFVSLQPPLSYYTSAAVFKIFGTSLLSLRIFGLFLFLLLPLLIYAVGRNFMGRIASFAAAAPVCVLGMPYMRFVPFAVWQGIAASVAAALFWIVAMLSKRPWLGFTAGCLTASSLFLRHDQAIYTGTALVVFTIALIFTGEDFRNLRRVFILWLVGIAAVCVPLLIFWSKIGALPEMFRQLVIFPFATYRKTSALPFPGLLAQKSFLDFATAVLFYIPPIVQAIAAIYLVQSIVRRCFQVREAILIFLTVWSGLFYLQSLVRSDLTHLLMTLPPFFLLAAFGWSMVRERIPRPANVIVSSAVVLVVASFLWALRPVVLPDMSEEKEILNLPRGGVRIAQAAVIGDFFHNLQQAVPADRAILALPYQPMFYFLSERRNPTRWNYLWPGDQTEREHQVLIEQVEHDPPALVLLAEQREVARFAPIIVEYVRQQYIYTDSLGDIGIYVRRSDR
jgi:4-amino-4-deoxy-L-arabinose transferase-like glycosyltransferase